MGGFFGDIARTAGGAANDLGTAKLSLQNIQQKLAAQKTSDLLARLNMQEGQQRIAESQQKMQQADPAFVRTRLKAALGRDPTDAEVQTYMGINQKPEAAKAGIDRDGLQQQLTALSQDEDASPTQKRVWASLAEEVSHTPSTDIAGLQKVEDQMNRLMQSWAKPAGDAKNPYADTRVDASGKLRGTNVKTGAREDVDTEKYPVPKEGGAAASPALDQLVYKLASGGVQPNKWPTGKLLAQTLNRAKELNVDLEQPATGSDKVAAAQKEYQAELDKSNKWQSDWDKHYVENKMIKIPNPYTQSLAEKLQKLNDAKAATAGATGTGAATHIWTPNGIQPVSSAGGSPAGGGL